MKPEDKILKELALNAKFAGRNDLAIVLFTFLGARKANMSSDFARYCQSWAREQVEELKFYQDVNKAIRKRNRNN